MTTTPPHAPHEADESLTFLGRVEEFLAGIERLLRRLIYGIGVFFLHRIPKWTYEFIRDCLENVWTYIERAARILFRLSRVMIWSAVLLAIVVGPFLALNQSGAPDWTHLVWGLMIGCAIVFGFRRHIRQEIERVRDAMRARRGGLEVCSHCKRKPRGAVPPAHCDNCGNPWKGERI